MHAAVMPLIRVSGRNICDVENSSAHLASSVCVSRGFFHCWFVNIHEVHIFGGQAEQNMSYSVVSGTFYTYIKPSRPCSRHHDCICHLSTNGVILVCTQTSEHGHIWAYRDTLSRRLLLTGKCQN